MCVHVQLRTYVYVCASVHLGSLDCMGTRICGWGCLVHVIRAYVHIIFMYVCMHSKCKTLSIKSSKKQVLVFSVQRMVNICRTKVHVCVWVSSRYIAVDSLVISYNIRNHATYKFQPTIKNLHAQRHVLP